MHVTLFRNGHRTLLLPSGEKLVSYPTWVRRWLGEPVECREALLSGHAQSFLGISLATVLSELLRQGFCAVDGGTVVHKLPSASGRGASATLEDQAP